MSLSNTVLGDVEAGRALKGVFGASLQGGGYINITGLRLKNLTPYEVSAYAECIRLTLCIRIYFRYADPRREFFDPCRPNSPLVNTPKKSVLLRPTSGGAKLRLPLQLVSEQQTRCTSSDANDPDMPSMVYAIVESLAACIIFRKCWCHRG